LVIKYSHKIPSITYEIPIFEWLNFRFSAELPALFAGGPRGQLALHPAAAQFLLDNAQNAQRTGGDERG